jgi:hypothetical protein
MRFCAASSAPGGRRKIFGLNPNKPIALLDQTGSKGFARGQKIAKSGLHSWFDGASRRSGLENYGAINA